MSEPVEVIMRLWGWVREVGGGKGIYTPKQVEISRDGRIKVQVEYTPNGRPLPIKNAPYVRLAQGTVKTSAPATILTATKAYTEMVLRFCPLETGDIVVKCWLLPNGVSATADGYVVWRKYIGDVDEPDDVSIPGLSLGCKLVVQLEAGTDDKTSYALFAKET
jgi:hypothetical protein